MQKSVCFCAAVLLVLVSASLGEDRSIAIAIDSDGIEYRGVSHPVEGVLPSQRPVSEGVRSIALSYTAWTAVGPGPLTSGGTKYSGRIAALAAHPTDANTIYIAAAGGGVWKTTDGGTSWTPLTDNQATCFMGAVAVAPSDPNTIYAGTGEPNNSIDSFYGRGILKSTDGGSTWSLLGAANFDRRTVAAIAIHPTDPNTVYVAIANGNLGVGGNRGIWKTTDGGLNWINTTTAISSALNYSDIVMHPTNPSILYCAIGTYSGATLNGVYVSNDAGATWAIAGDFPTNDTTNGRIRIAISKSNPQVLYASIQHSTTFALYKMMTSVNGGTNWVQLTNTPNYMGSQGWYDTTLIVDPTSELIVYAGGAAGTNSFIKTSTGGTAWSDIHTGGDSPHVDHHGIGFDANGKLLDGNDGGIWRLDNPNVGTISWTNLNGNLNTIQFTGVALHPTNADIAIGGSQDNGTEKFTGSLPWSQIRGGDGGFCKIDLTTPTTYYHTFFYSGVGFLERSDNSGSTWAGKTSGINTADTANFYPPYVMDPANSSRLLLGTNRVYETTNRADSWTAISAPATNGWLNNATTAVNAIGVAKTDSNTVYAAGGNRLMVTTNHGGLWTVRNPTNPGNISQIIVDPTDATTAYCVRNNFGGGKVFRTTNAGVNWTNITGNLPDIPVPTIALDPRGPGSSDDVLYVGTDAAVYRSIDLGASWSIYASGFPNAQVVELVLKQDNSILAAGTHGRGMWEILVPPSGSCCFADGSCTITAQADCNGTSWTLAGVCSPNTCPQPTGACCPGDGSCQVTTQANCSGTWTAGGTCSPNLCPPVGSCCQLDGSCQVTTQANCTGNWTQDGVCSPNTCPQPTGACCFANGSCQGGQTSAQCTGQGGTYQGNGSVCPASCLTPCLCPGDVNGDGKVDGLDIACFTTCVLNILTPGCNCGCADMDSSGLVDLNDVAPFVSALLAGQVCAAASPA